VEDYKKTTDEIYECIANQRKVWEETNLPEFASVSGACYKCGRNIYQNYELTNYNGKYISHGYDGKTLVTGCPHCHYSFCS